VMAHLFRSTTYRVDASDPKDSEVSAQVSKLVASAPAPSRAPRPAPAVALLGPPGSGTAEQAARLAAKFKVVLISADELVAAAVVQGTEIGKKAKVYKETDAPVPDELICSLVIERMGKEDCRRHGWILEGFPKTSSQATYLEERGVHVRDVVSLDLSTDKALKAITGRRIDPLNGTVHHVDALPAGMPQEVFDRLVQHPRDTKEVAGRRLRNYSEGKDSVVAFYGPKARVLDADTTADVLFERLCPFLLRMDERHLV